MKKGVIFILIGLLALAVAGAGFAASDRGVGDMEIAKGELIVEEGAADEEFGIRTDAVILIRTVEMFQYVKSSLGDYYYDTGFYDTHQPDITVKNAFGREEIYHNPSFPSRLKSEVFGGKIRLGDSGLYVADELLKKLSLGSYIYFKNEHSAERIYNLPEDGGSSFGLKAYDGFYAKKPDGWSPDVGWKVGDIRVRYNMVMPEQGMIYTVAGDINGDIIGEGRGDNVAYIYDYDSDKTVEQIAKEYETSNRNVGIGGIVVGILFVALGVGFIVRARRE